MPNKKKNFSKCQIRFKISIDWQLFRSNDWMGFAEFYCKIQAFILRNQKVNMEKGLLSIKLLQSSRCVTNGKLKQIRLNSFSSHLMHISNRFAYEVRKNVVDFDSTLSKTILCRHRKTGFTTLEYIEWWWWWQGKPVSMTRV